MGSVIRFVAIAISAVVVLGFAMFAIDETDKGSKTQQEKLERELGDPAEPVAPTARRRRRASPSTAPSARRSTTPTTCCSRRSST